MIKLFEKEGITSGKEPLALGASTNEGAYNNIGNITEEAKQKLIEKADRKALALPLTLRA